MNVDSSSSSSSSGSTFRCLMGWRGDNCDQCVTSAGCINGFCHLPYQCICRGGWRGELCDIGNQFFLSVFLFWFLQTMLYHNLYTTEHSNGLLFSRRVFLDV